MPSIYDAPDASQSSNGGALATLSTLMGLKQKQQAIQAQQLQMAGQASQNQSLVAEAQAQTQQMRERQGLQNVMQSQKDERGDSILSDAPDPVTGKMEPDPNKIAAYAQRNMPLTGQAVQQSLLKTQTDRLGLADSAANLGDKYRDDLSGIINAAKLDPNASTQSITQQLQAYGDQNRNNPDVQQAVRYASSLVSHVDNAPNVKARNAILNGTAMTLQPSLRTAEQVTPQPEPVQTKQGIQFVNKNANAPQPIGTPLGVPVKNTIPPTVVTYPNQTLGVIGGANGGGLGGSVPNRGPSQPSGKLQPIKRPGANDPGIDQENYNANMQAARSHVQDVADAATNYQNGIGASRYRNDQILDILKSNNPVTGPSAEKAQWLASKLPGDEADAYDKIGHYLAQNSAAIAAKMGVPKTNAGAATAEAGAGNLRQNPGALAEITKVNDALNTSLDMYNRGLAKVSNNGADPSKVAAFRQAFGQNFDVNVFRAIDANRRDDPEEKAKLKALPQAERDDIVRKSNILKSLANTGDLP